MATILIVDDLAANRKVLATLLRCEGHRLLEAGDGVAGLAAVHAEHPDLVITDVLMPVMDGYEFIRHLRLDPATSRIPVVFCTAHYGEREARALALSSGVADVLIKPIDPEDVLTIVGRALAGESETGVPPEAIALTTAFDREHLRLVTDKLSEKASDLKSANERLRALINIGLELASERDSDRLLQSVSAAARDLFGATYVTLGILDRNDRTVERVVTAGVDAGPWIKAGDHVSGLLGTIVAERRTLRGDNPGGDPSRLQLPSHHPDIQAFLAAPIASPAHVYGWMCLVSNEGTTFTEDDEQLVMALSGQVGRIYENGYFYSVAQKRTAELEHEILERQKLDQGLRDQHFYTRSLIESNIDALMATDPHGIITDVNKQTEALTGCTRNELIGAPFKNYFTDSDRAEAGINRVLDEGTVVNYELTARARDGTQTVVSYNATTFHDRDRRLRGVFAAARDMTELKRFEQALQDKNVELEAASRMKSEFVSNMSHELRTPLNAILGFSAVLKDGLAGEMSAQQGGFISDIFTSGTHLLSLVDDILDLSCIEAGRMVLDLEPVIIHSLLAKCLSIVKEKAAVHNIRMTMDVPEALGSMNADARKVKQIVYNLLYNALKFNADGGHVILRAGRVPRADVGRLSGSWIGRSLPFADKEFAEFLKVSVTDSGIGISPQGLEHLFRPFIQIDTGLARKFEGAGLGLTMVKRLVELHGGAVAVESAVGEGSCFTVWLPLRAPEEAALTLAHAPAPARIETLVS